MFDIAGFGICVIVCKQVPVVLSQRLEHPLHSQETKVPGRVIPKTLKMVPTAFFLLLLDIMGVE